MGWATVALSVFQAVSSISSANKEAKQVASNASAQAQAVVEQGNLASKEKAKEIRARVARQTNSFLNSGLTLEGTPGLAIDQTYSTGLEDLNQIAKNSNITARNITSQGKYQAGAAISNGRSKAIEAMAGGFSNTDFGSMGSLFGATTAGVQSAAAGTGFGTGYDVYNSVNNPSNSGIF